MGIPLLHNPFGAERSTRQRLLNTVQQTGDYIMSQHVVMTASTQCHKLKNAPVLYVCHKCIAVIEARHCHTEVSPSENGPPRILWQVIAEIGLTEYGGIGQK